MLVYHLITLVASFLLLTFNGYVMVTFFQSCNTKEKKDILTNSLNLFYSPIQVNITCVYHINELIMWHE